MAQVDLLARISGKDELTPTLKNTQKAVEDLGKKGDALKRIQDNFERIKSSSAPLGKRFADIKKEMQKLQSMGQGGSPLFKEMTKQAQQLKAEMKQVDNAINSTGNKWKDTISKFSSSAGLGNIGGNIASLVTNPYVAAGAAVVGATKALYDYGAELDRSLQKTAQFTGLSGDELIQLRSGIKSTADTFGKDYDEVLSTVDGLTNQFGISSQEALKIVKDGFVAGADEGGNMLSMISQFQGAFNDAGISASEMVAIIGNTRSGIFSEEGMNLIAKGGTKIREFSDKLKESLEGVGINADQMYNKLQSGEMSTVQAIQAISTQLKGLNPQSQEVGEVLKQVFGKQGAQAGYELVTALADVNSNLEEVKKQTGETGEAFENLQKAEEEFQNAMASLFGGSEKGFSTMTTQLKADVYGAVAKCINGFIDWYNNSIQLRGTIANLAFTFKATWEVIKGILKVFMNAVIALSDMIEGVFNLNWEQVKAGWNKGVSSILKNISDGFANIKEDAQEAVEQTLNGKIKKIEVPVEPTYSDNKNKGKTFTPNANGTEDETKGKKGKSSTKTETVKTQIEIDRENLKKVQTELQNAISDFNSGLISKEQLQEAVDEANAYFEANNIKAKAEIDYTTDANGFETAKQVIKPKVDLTPLEEAKKKYEDLYKELQKVNPFETPESELEELKRQVREAQKAYDDLKEALSTEITTSYKGIDTDKPLVKGSLQDRRQSLEKANADAEQVRADLKLGLINADEARSKIKEITDQLQSEFPDLSIDLKVNDDGTISTAAEDLQKAQQKLGAIGGTVDALGSAFGSLGSAVGGTGGEVMQFAGQSMQAISQMLPQIMALIGAKEAQAIAEGTASGAGLPFPANLAAIASIVATIAGVFASLPAFETGGIVGGTSFKGDHVIARLNSGEGVLTRAGVDNVNRLYNSVDTERGGGGTIKGDVNFRISGGALVGTLNNHNAKVKKQS